MIHKTYHHHRERKLRLFIGIPLEHAIDFSPLQQQLADLLDPELELYNTRLSIVKHPHVTIAFIGESAQKNIATIERVMSKAMRSYQDLHDAPVLTILPGVVRRGKNALALNINAPASLYAFVQDLRSKLIHQGIEIDRQQFLPHVSIARVPQGAFHHDPYFCDPFQQQFDALGISSHTQLIAQEVILYDSRERKHHPLVRISFC